MDDSRKIKTLVFGMMDGSNKRGRPHRGWSDDIEQWCGATLQELNHAALDRQRWAAIVTMASDTNGCWVEPTVVNDDDDACHVACCFLLHVSDYPCPLVSVRNRKPVYGEIGHTIMNLLADFHKYQYTLPQIGGLLIHMEEKRTSVCLPRSRYNVVSLLCSSLASFVFEAKDVAFKTKAKDLEEKQGLGQGLGTKAKGKKTQAQNQRHSEASITGTITSNTGFDIVRSWCSTPFQFCAQTVGNNKKEFIKILGLWPRTSSQGHD